MPARSVERPPRSTHARKRRKHSANRWRATTKPRPPPRSSAPATPRLLRRPRQPRSQPCFCHFFTPLSFSAVVFGKRSDCRCPQTAARGVTFPQLPPPVRARSRASDVPSASGDVRPSAARAWGDVPPTCHRSRLHRRRQRRRIWRHHLPTTQGRLRRRPSATATEENGGSQY